MNIKRAKTEIKNAIEAYLMKDGYGNYEIPAIRQRPIFLMGPPGIGKTQIMEQIARECEVGLVSYTITHHTRQSAIGLPFISEKNYGGQAFSVTEYTMSEIIASVYDKIERTGLSEGILFIDEINCVSETLAPTMLQFLQYKTFGNHQVPGGWIIVTAGNPPEYNKSVREFDIATLDRIKKINVEADFAVWKEYAYQVSIHPAVISYLNAKQNYFYQIETTVDGKIFATPRGWEDLSRLIEVYEKTGKTVDREVVFQYIQHAKIAKDFANYLELYYKYQSDYKIDSILEGQINEELCRKVGTAAFDEKLSVIGLILARLGGLFRQVYRKEAYLERLMEYLKGYQDFGKENGIERLEQLIEGAQSEWDQKKASELLGREEDRRYQDLLGTLDQYLLTVREEHMNDAEQIFERIRQMFLADSQSYEKLSEQGLAMLEAAFDFMEAAFGDSQEMVVFITELNTNSFSVHFLQENECERYYQYNKKLLFKDRETDLLRQLDDAFGRE